MSETKSKSSSGSIFLPSIIAFSIYNFFQSQKKNGISSNVHGGKFKKTSSLSMGKNNLTKDELQFILEQEYATSPALRFEKPPVIVSLTTSPNRLQFLPWVFKTLDMSLVNEIHLNIPVQYQNKSDMKYSQEELHTLAAWFPKLKVFWNEKDIGPIMKLLPTLNRVLDPKTIVITIDDDMAYPKNLVYNCLEYLQTNPEVDTVVNATWPAWILGKKYALFSKKENDAMISEFGDNFLMIEGFQGVAYRYTSVRECIDKLHFYSQKNLLCLKNDDVVISSVLHMHKKNIKAITHHRSSTSSKFVKTRMLSYGFGPDALHQNLEHHGVYYQVLKHCMR